MKENIVNTVEVAFRIIVLMCFALQYIVWLRWAIQGHHGPLVSKPLQILLWNLQNYFIIITSTNKQEYITLSRFLYELLPFFRILVKFFVLIHFFSKPIQILFWNLQHFFTIITSINRQEYITLSRFLYDLLPFFRSPEPKAQGELFWSLFVRRPSGVNF